jgi:hypothetical protein
VRLGEAEKTEREKRYEIKKRLNKNHNLNNSSVKFFIEHLLIPGVA